MYDLIGDLSHYLSDPNSSGLTSATVESAVVVGIFGLLTVTLSFLFDGARSRQRRARRHSSPAEPTDHGPDDDERLHIELINRAVRAETALAELQVKFDEQKGRDRRTIRRLREFLAAKGYNPDRLPPLTPEEQT